MLNLPLLEKKGGIILSSSTTQPVIFAPEAVEADNNAVCRYLCRYHC
jgi:hypothetical protein